MTFTAYATPDDLTDWLDAEVPINASSLLRSATFVVARGANRNPYTDVPSSTDVPPLRDATCAQASSWIALGVDPATLGIGGPTPVKSSSVLGAKVDYDTTSQAKALEALAQADLAPEAASILLAAGLLWLPVPVGASQFDSLPQWGQGRRWWPSPEPMSGEWEWPYGGDAWPFL